MKAFIVGLQFILFFTFSGILAQNPKQSIVKVTAHFSDNQIEVGGGIITGFNDLDKEVFLVTARHIFIKEDKDGTILAEAERLTVEFQKGRDEFSATIDRVDPELDLAVLKVNLKERAISFKKLVVAQTDDYTRSIVNVIGHPQGSEWVLNSNEFLSTESYNFSISHDGISTGYSGGGVFTKYNRLMGMMVQNRSHDALVLDIAAILELLNEWKVETNLLGRPKIKYGTLAVMGTGVAGVAVSIFHFERKSKDLYSIYEEHPFSNDPIYTTMGTTRDEVFEDANSKHNTAIIVGAVGGTVLAIGTYVIIRKLSKRKKERRYDGLTVRPYFDMPDYVLSSGNAVAFGLSIKF